MRRLEDFVTPLAQCIAEQRPYECDYDAIVELIESDELLYREEFRSAELAGTLAPHYFVENPLDAVCQAPGCSLVIRFYHGKAPLK